MPRAVAQLVPERDQLARGLLVFDLRVGQRSGVLRAPVDDPFPAVDQPVPVHANERLRHGFAARQQAVIAEYQRVLVSEIAGQALTLLDLEAGSFEIMIGEVDEPHRGLRQRQ